MQILTKFKGQASVVRERETIDSELRLLAAPYAVRSASMVASRRVITSTNARRTLDELNLKLTLQ